MAGFSSRALLALAAATALVALAGASGSTLNTAMSDYSVQGSEVYFYVYRVHNVLKELANDNAASPGGEVGFLTREYGYQDGIILRDCVTMKNSDFAPYQCCNGGSCNSCSSDAGSGTNSNSDLPGRAFQIYPPSGSPCSSQTQVQQCSAKPGDGCTGDCSGWWYSFPKSGRCAVGDSIGTNGCTWKSSSTILTVEYADLIKNKGFETSGTSSWTTFLKDVNILVDAFSDTSMVSAHELGSSGTFTASSATTGPTPANGCQVPSTSSTSTSTGSGDGSDGDGDGWWLETTDDTPSTKKDGNNGLGVGPIIAIALAVAAVAAVAVFVAVRVVRRRRGHALDTEMHTHSAI